MIFLNTEPSVLYSDERNELAAVIFDEENIVIAQLELGRVGHFHGLAVHRASEHPNGVGRARVALERVVDFEGNESDNAMLGAFANPLRLHPGYLAFENDLRATHEFVEIRRDNRGRVGDQAKREEDGENQESEWLFHFANRGETTSDQLKTTMFIFNFVSVYGSRS